MARAAPLAKAQGATAAPARAAEAPREREPAKARGAVRERDQALVAALGQDRSLGSRFKAGKMRLRRTPIRGLQTGSPHSTASQKFIFLPCRHWKHAQPLTVAKDACECGHNLVWWNAGLFDC